MNEDKGYVTKNVVLYPREFAVVRSAQRRLGLASNNGFSAALRYIINDWARMQAQRPEALAVRGEGEGAAGLHGD